MGVARVEFIERIVGTLHSAIEKVAGIGGLSVVGQFRQAAIHGKIRGRCGGAALKQTHPGGRKAKQVKNVEPARTVGGPARTHAAHSERGIKKWQSTTH